MKVGEAPVPSEAVDELLAWIERHGFGSVWVEHALASIDRDAEDEAALFLSLTLRDPGKGKATWPLRDVLALRRGVLEKASELGLTTPVYVRLNPTTEAPQDDDETATQTGT